MKSTIKHSLEASQTTCDSIRKAIQAATATNPMLSLLLTDVLGDAEKIRIRLALIESLLEEEEEDDDDTGTSSLSLYLSIDPPPFANDENESPEPPLQTKRNIRRLSL